MRLKYTAGIVLSLAAATLMVSVTWGTRQDGGQSAFELTRTGQGYTLEAKDAPVADILKELARLGATAIQVDERMQARVTVSLKDAPIEQVLAALTRSRALVYEKQQDGQERLASARVTSEQDAIAPAAPAAPQVPEELANLLKPRDVKLRPGVLTNSDHPGELATAGAAALRLRTAVIDTKALVEQGRDLDVPEAFRARPDTTCWIVQFDRPVSSADKLALAALGAEVSHYVPNRAYAVRIAADKVAALRAVPGVYALEPYHPYFKMEETIRAALGGDAEAASSDAITAGQFQLITFGDEEISAKLSAAGLDVTGARKVGTRTIYKVKANTEQLAAVVAMDEVNWVEPQVVMKPMNDMAARRIRAPALRALHPTLTGEGVTVGVTDTGIDFLHGGFADSQGLPTSTGLNTRIAYYEARPGPYTEGLPGDINGHGSHVSGSILGNGAFSTSVISSPGSEGPPYGTNQFAGVAPRARVIMLEDFNSFSDDEQTRIIYQRGGRISNNSWGANAFQYNLDSQAWDSRVRDADNTVVNNQELIVFFAAGNAGNGQSDGVGGEAGTIGTPGNAKNVITIGALEQPRFANNIEGVFFGDVQYFAHLESDSDWQVASFSSRGPVTENDLRVKPDLVAPGSYVLSVQSHETLPDDYANDFNVTDYRYGNVNSGTNYAYFQGTSMATPVAAGGAALVYQYLTNALGASPSPALMKAVLVAGARPVNTIVYRKPQVPWVTTVVDDGWGALDVRRSVDGPGLRPQDYVLALDQGQTTPLETGELYSRQVTVGGDEGGLKIVLAWTDWPGDSANGPELKNDLDLVVFAPNGGVYMGNIYDSDGVHSYRFTTADNGYRDFYNNVESVLIPAGAGTYTIRVIGTQVPEGPQDYALVVQKGIGFQGRTPGNNPAMALDTAGLPVVAYSDDSSVEGNFSNLTRQIFVKRWVGPYGDAADLGQWRRLEDQWYALGNSLDFGGISRTVERSDYPAIAVKGTNVYVAWEENNQSLGVITNQRVFLKKFDGVSWSQLGGSAEGYGIPGYSGFDSTKPQVGVMADGSPVVSWLQGGATTSISRVFLARWNGTNWVGLAGSNSNGVPSPAATKLATNLTMAINSSGNPVVAFKEESNPDGIVVLQWGGASWANISPADSPAVIEKPRLAAGQGGSLFLAWVQTYNAAPGIYQQQQVYALRWNGGGWVAMGNSTTFPGISAATNDAQRPYNVDIAAAFNTNVTVVWEGGASNGTRSILARRWAFGATNWLGISGSAEVPGITKYQESFQKPVVAVDGAGIPVVSFLNTVTQTNVQEVLTYGFVGDNEPPKFDGLQSAVGGTNGDVSLSWLPAVDALSSNILYRIYRGTQTFACGVAPDCNVSNVFANPIALLTNATSYLVTGLTPNQSYCFGVRAIDTNGLEDANTSVRSAGPVSGSGDNDADCLANGLEVAAGTEPCQQDTDGDGMLDGWEWTYSTNNPSHPSYTNPAALQMNPLDNGVDNIRTIAANDGDVDQLPDADVDGDGASNFEEYQWWRTFTFGTNVCEATSPTNRISPDPTVADTDGDGMPDGFEIFNNLNPTINDAAGDADGDGVSNYNEYLAGSDPRTPDTDGDGLSDSNEYYVAGTFLNIADSDRDGLDDGFEVQVGSNPKRADSNGSFLTDGELFQLGYDPALPSTNFNMFLYETFETSSTTVGQWTNYNVNAFLPARWWYLSTVEPETNSLTNTSGMVFFDTRSTNRSYRAANDPAGTNLNAHYSGAGSLAMALQAPTLVDQATNATSLFVSWLEWYETEPNADFALLQVRGSGNTNWFNASTAVSGKSGVTNLNSTAPTLWVRRTADISGYVGQSNVQVRFLFTANNINNQFKGWFVDDVRVYEAVKVSGWVRDANGRAIEGAVVRAIGRGGVTNVLEGHRYVRPGRVFGESVAGEDGSFSIIGLPAGNYYVKAEAASHVAEFQDGGLFTSYTFGGGLRPGVPDRDGVSTNGIVRAVVPGTVTNVYFELEKGSGRGRAGVALESGSGLLVPVLANGQILQVWNGATNGTAGFTNYIAATNLSVLGDNHPDYLTNAVKPTLLGDLAPGLHRLYAGTNLTLYPLPQVEVREGEVTLLGVATNYAEGRLFVATSNNASYAIRLDGRLLTNRTPAAIPLKAGLHEVLLASTTSAYRIAPRMVQVPIGGRASVVFGTNDLAGQPGNLFVRAVDINANPVTGLTIFVNGVVVTSNDVAGGDSPVTPAHLTLLRPGVHQLSVAGSGYKISERREVNVFSDVTNEQVFIAYQADQDYDRVGDATELAGYTNIFLYHRDDDPDNDTLNNLQEFNLNQLFNVRVNAFNADSDGDGLADGAEVGYDGFSNRLALTRLATNALQFAGQVQTLFVGQYLAGVDNFGVTTAAVSIAGDRFVGTITHPLLAVPTKQPALTVYTGVSPSPSNIAVDVGHQADAEVFADGLPDRPDTDGDLLWDGFEFTNGLSTIAQLDVIEAGRAQDDPDADGLSNLLEFLGTNSTADILDSTSAILADSDGDFLPDGWEYAYHFKPNDPSDAFDDPDGDGLVNLGEFLAGTDPLLRDTDADFLPDFEEAVIYNSNPRVADSDGDGLLDGREVWDKDLDGIQDGGFFPSWAGGDLDNDGFIDGPTDWDTDGDGMPDGFEVIDAFGRLRSPALNPFDPTDGDDDPDGDGLTSYQEYLVRDSLYGNNPSVFGGLGVVWDYSADPFDPDSDDDGMPDGFEVLYGLHPMDPAPCSYGNLADGVCTRYGSLGAGGDPDGDGLWNLREYNIRFRLNSLSPTNDPTSLSTHPWSADTDLDGLGDGEEDRSFISHPVLQDADDDHLVDGVSVSNKWGEVESAARNNAYVWLSTNVAWFDALATAQVSHAQFFGSPYSNIVGHLAVFSDPFEAAQVILDLGITGTNIAIGGINQGPGWNWVTYEPFLLATVTGTTAGVTNGLTLDDDGSIKAVTNEAVVDGYIIEWEDVISATNHFDQALNDLWQLVWPADPDNNLPFWRPVALNTNSPVPEPRWGTALSYVPVYETKKPRNDTGTILMDNRQLVMMGGRDGVNRFKDVWEYVVRSNTWVKSVQPLFGLAPGYYDGLSELHAVPMFGYKNTKASACPCTDVPYDCDGDGVGLPKNRPWSNSRSFDWTFIFGGWSEGHAYTEGHWFYKSTDDPRGVVDEATASQGVTEFINAETNLTAAAQTGAGVATFLIGNPPCCLTLDGDPGDDATGYSGIQFPDVALKSSCDEILQATLILTLEAQPASAVAVDGVAEYTLSLGHSDPAYTSDPDTREPSLRWVSGTFFRSSQFSFTIATTALEVQVDVTRAVQDIVASGGWDSSTFGFVFDATGSTDYGVIRTSKSKLRVTYKPSYKVPPRWAGAGRLSVYSSQVFSKRKSSGLAFDYERNRMVMFGGIDGNVVYGDTHTGEVIFNGGYDPLRVDWLQITPSVTPPARWGHSMVYDAKNDRVVMFGGFDANHRPLNDLWFFSVETGLWTEFTGYRDDQIPMPRGGASMAYYGDYDYSRGIDEYCLGGNKKKVVMFGGTDGNTYFNDSWVFSDDDSRWILISPAGEQSVSPPPRAFASMVFAQNARTVPDVGGGNTYRASQTPPCATPVVFMFGGRMGALPTGRDTDMDMVTDGQEYELGGATAGRDPRVNALVLGTTLETIPFAFKRIGSVRSLEGLLGPRGAIANFESLRHDKPDVELAVPLDIPYEGHPDQWTEVTYSPFGPVGVDATIPGQTTLWYHRHAGENPFDARDVWDLGRPDQTFVGTNAAPRYAYSGRWVYGTDLNGNYPNNAQMELYSPLVSLEIPSLDSTSSSNGNSFFLVFQEWLDLADPNDVVRIEAVRPTTPADIVNRVTGMDRPVKPVLPNRNNAYNTGGHWRRTIVPLDILANEPNIYLRFTLQSDSNNVAGGWYIDDVAILQGGEIEGSGADAGVEVCLLGENANDEEIQCTTSDGSGNFEFGLLPLGNYQLTSMGVTNGPMVLSGPGLVTNVSLTSVAPPEFTSIIKTNPVIVTWSATNGMVYKLDYTTNILQDVWSPLTLVTGDSGSFLSYTDAAATPERIYRVAITNAP